MSNTPQYCQNCGTKLNGEAYCPRCQKATGEKGEPNKNENASMAPRNPSPRKFELTRGWLLAPIVLVCFVAGMLTPEVTSHKGFVEGRIYPIFFLGSILIALLCGVIGGKAKAAKFISIGLVVWTFVTYILAFYFDAHCDSRW